MLGVRNRDIAIRVLEGEPISKLALEHKISPTRTRDIVLKMCWRGRLFKGEKYPYRDTSMDGCETIEDAREKWITRRLHDNKR